MSVRRGRCAVVAALLTVMALPLMLLPHVVAAQAEPETSPDTVVRRYMEAVRAGDWHSAAALMHPEALAQFRRMIFPAFETDTPGRELRDQFFDGMRLPEIRQLSEGAFFERFFRGMIARSPELLGIMQGAEVEVVGHVREGDDVAHVVYRMEATVSELSFTRLDVMSVKRLGTTWRLLLTGTMEGLAAALSRPAGER